MAGNVTSTISLDVMQCTLVDRYRHLQGTCSTKRHCVTFWKTITLKKTKTFTHDGWQPDLGSNSGPPESEVVVLTTHL
jgi:hypothetical protein